MPDIGTPQVRVGLDSPNLGPTMAEVNTIAVTETSEIVYLRHILSRINMLDFKVNLLLSIARESLWQRILRWLGIR